MLAQHSGSPQMDSVTSARYPGIGDLNGRGDGMPKQELYLDIENAGEHTFVVKSYDSAFAKEAFEAMTDEACQELANSLALDDNSEAEDIPERNSGEFSDFLWQTLSDSAREDGQLFSYFIVATKPSSGAERFLFVSGDWPSAEAYARKHAQEAHAASH